MANEKAQSGRLSDYREGNDLLLLKIDGIGSFKKRLLEMGFAPGVKIRIVKYAPLKDPLEIQVRNCHISLRVCEADKILVTPDGEPEKRLLKE